MVLETRQLKLLSALALCLNVMSCGVAVPEIQKTEGKYYVVNLDRSEHRLAHMVEQFYHAGLSFTRFPAVEGKALDLETLSPSIFIPNQPLNMRRRTSVKMTPGEIGAYLSHYSVIKLGYEEMTKTTSKYTAIFEDDTSFTPLLDNQIRSTISKLPASWDILYLGCNANSFPECVFEQQESFGNAPYVKLNQECIAGLYSYVVSPSGAKKLLDNLLPIRIPIDEWIADHIVAGEFGEFNAYCANPEIVMTGDFMRDVVGR